MEKLRIGVIGVGGRGVLAENWKDNPRSQITAGADVNEKRLDEFKNRIDKDVFTTTDYREMLERADVDAVAVLSPDFVHEEHTIAAL